MSNNSGGRERYFVEVVAKALDVLDSFRRPEDELTLSEIARRTNLPPSHVFRLLHTLEQKGWVRKVSGSKRFHRVNRTQRWRVGFAMQSGQFRFSLDLLRGLEESAEKHGVTLIVLDNELREDVALANAQTFVRQGVDFVIEFQVNERIAPVIAHTLAEATIPSLAIDIPQPGAVFFGANNYQAGLIAGRALGVYAEHEWEGRFDKILLLEQPIAGAVPQARMTGAVNGIKEVTGEVDEQSVIHLDAGTSEEDSHDVTLRFLESVPERARILVATIHDQATLGALRAIRESGRTRETIGLVGHNATSEGRTEMCRPDSPLIGLVGFFPEKYGEQIIPLVLKILAGEAVPPMAFIDHALITRENVSRFYPAP